mgnify:CR=1 FL=1
MATHLHARRPVAARVRARGAERDGGLLVLVVGEGRFGVSVGDVLANASAEEQYFLRHDGHAIAQGVQVVVARITAVNGDTTGHRLIEAQDQ